MDQDALTQPGVVALLDLNMPGMNGVEALQALSEFDHSVPVMLTSGFTELDQLSACSDHVICEAEAGH